MYGELKVRCNATEVAHDDFVSYLKVAEGEEQWLEMIAERFDNLEKDIGVRLSEIFKEGGRKSKWKY